MNVEVMSSCQLTSSGFSQQQSQDRNLTVEPFSPGGAHDGCEWALLGESVAARQLRTQIHRIAPYYRTALIRGEAGTGKKFVAQAIHSLSPVSEGPFIVANARLLAESVDCGDSPDRNFTASAAGVLQPAEGGTLYLTRVGDLSYGHQTALMRFFSVCGERRSTWTQTDSGRVGGREVREAGSLISNTRILAASDCDLRPLASIGQFRQDLYARLSGLEIFISPLRQRVADIPILTESLLRRLAEESGCSPKLLAESALLWLQRYSWPNNLCELEQVIAEATDLAEGGMIEMRHLLAAVEPQVAELPMPSTPRIERLHDVMQRHVLDVLTRCGGNKVRAAELLGISRSTLYRMLGISAASGASLSD